MISFEELNGMPEAGRLKRLFFVTAGLWCAALLLFILALSSLSKNAERLSEAERVLSGAVTIRSYPKLEGAAGREPLSAVSEILDKLALRPKVTQLASSPAGLLVQINRLYPEEFSKFSEEMQRNGLLVKTAEIRAMEGPADGRLLNVSLTLEGEAK
ncbi:MAG: type II secretion system protein GspM [Cloacibacillus sp.]